MTFKDLASKIAQIEGLKSEVSIGNIREILRALADLAASDPEAYNGLLNYIKRRSKK
jgi:hypothetical protein